MTASRTSQNRQLGVGFLGAGPLNRTHHMPNIAQIPQARIEAVCDLDADRLASAAQRYRPRLATRDFDQMLADQAVELVIIATAPPLQADLTRRALAAGKHVFVEKPMAETAQQCLQIGALARQVGRYVATGYNRRFSPAYRDLKQVIDSRNVPPMMSYRLLDDDRGRRNWTDRPHLIDEVCHIFDILAWLANDQPVQIFCLDLPGQNYQILIRFAHGATAHILTGGRGNFAWPKERIEVVLDHVVLAVDDFVELRAANVPGLERKCYPGREYEGYPGGYAQRLAQEGLGLELQLRRQIAELWQTDGLADMPPGPQREALRQRVFAGKALPPVNYMVDKGWFAAMQALVASLLADQAPPNAGPADAARSIACAEAAMQSVRSAEPVALDPAGWADRPDG